MHYQMKHLFKKNANKKNKKRIICPRDMKWYKLNCNLSCIFSFEFFFKGDFDGNFFRQSGEFGIPKILSKFYGKFLIKKII
jgi:hypothetical protein